jgi:hypothetical protein
MSSDRARSTVVWLVWAAALAIVLGFIARDGRNLPFEEDWLMVAPMTHHEPHLGAWLWSQNSEHRLPLPRLVNLGLLRATGDFRSTMVFDTLILAAVAAGMIVLARRLRGGRSSLADAFFPLLLLHLGQWDNLVWAWQIQFVLPTVLVCAVLLVILAHPASPASGGWAVGAALAVASLPLAGANGLVLAPPLAAWLVYAWWVARGERRTGPPAPLAWVGAAGGVTALVLCGVYFIGYQASPWNGPSPGIAATLATTAKFVIYGLGPVTAKAWVVFGAIAAAVLAASLAILLWALRTEAEERIRIVGLLAFFAACGILAAALGWGRAGRVAELGRMSPRYALLAAPLLCAAYFSLLVYGPGRLRQAGPAALALLAALLFPLNTREGLKRRDWFGAGMAAFEQDLATGASIDSLAQRHYQFLLHWDEPLMAASMRQLRGAGFAPFRGLPTP